MNTFFRRVSFLALALVLVLFGSAVFATAQTAAPLNKHARKIQHKLTKYQQGNYLHLLMSNRVDAYGSLGTLSDASFTFTSADSNITATYQYADVDRVRADQEPIGEGAEPHHIRHLVPIAITAASLIAGGAIYAYVR